MQHLIQRTPDLRLRLIVSATQPCEVQALLRGAACTLSDTFSDTLSEQLTEQTARYYGPRVQEQNAALSTLESRPDLSGHDMDDLLIRAAIHPGVRRAMQEEPEVLRGFVLEGYLLALGMPGSRANATRASLASSDSAMTRYAQHATPGGTLRLPVLREPKVTVSA